MKCRPLGRTGVQVSELRLGTMTLGGDADEAESARMYTAGRDSGINFSDTADTYCDGESERVLGRLMKGHRDELVIATKCYNPWGDDVNAGGASRLARFGVARHDSGAEGGDLRPLAHPAARDGSIRGRSRHHGLTCPRRASRCGPKRTTM